MAGITREISITYGSYTIGAGTGLHPVGNLRFSQDYDSASFSCDFAVISTAPAALTGLVNTAQAALRKPRQDLEVTLGGVALVSWKPSANTGLDTEPSCEKIGQPTDSGCRQDLRMTVRCGLPADNLDLAGRRTSTISIDYDDSRRRTLRIEGEYTALSTNTATAQYASAISAYCTAVLTAQGGT